MRNGGCYNTCSNCNLSGRCCSNFNEINAPVLNRKEMFEIKKNADKIDFYKDGKCNIYNYRPLDCRLFPFDIIKEDLNYYLILYILDCINSEEMLQEVNNIDELVDSIKPWIDEFTDEMNYTKMKNLKYKIIREIE